MAITWVTGSFFNNELINSCIGARFYSIARSQPRWSRRKFPVVKELMPSRELLKKYKTGNMSSEEYTHNYNEGVLAGLTVNALKSLLELEDFDGTIVLLCWEKEGNFCHRRLVAQWLKKHGEEVNVF